MGIASWLGRISEEDAAQVTVLKNAGAIPYVRTNVPQTLQASLSITAATSGRAAD